jgi:hypothetical protein
MSLALDYDGVDDVTAVTVPNINGAAWTMGAWIRPDSIGESSGRIMSIWNGSAETHQFTLYSGGGGFNLSGSVLKSSTSIFAVSTTNVWAASEWRCMFFMWNASGLALGDCDLLVGSLTAAVASVGTTGTTSAGGVGTIIAGGTTLHVGNRSATDRSFDGRIARPFIVPWLMSVPEMEAYRLGSVGVLYAHGAPVVFHPYATAVDMSGNARNGTITGAVAAEGPPVPMRWRA